MVRPRSKIHGVGINDADYTVYKNVMGRIVCCPFYRVWKEMIRRCYCEKTKKTNKSYADVVVAEEWHTFSNFKYWMETQDWEGKQLDKDLLSTGVKIYSKETCIFISKELNLALSGEFNSKRELPTGVVFDKGVKKYRASFRNKYTGKSEYLGIYLTPEEAHNVWKIRKKKYIMELAKQESNIRIAEAINNRYN